MKCYIGNIVTVNQNNDVFQYLVEDQGRIQYVGNTLPKEYDQAEMIPLGDRALLPSFADTHQHFASFSTFHAGLNVMEAESNVEILEMVKEFAQKSSAKTLIAFGASPYSVAEKKLVSREELDLVCPDKEIMVVKYDGHACIINSRLLEKLEDSVKSLRGYHPDTGEMNQEAFFKVSNYLSNSLSLSELFRNMQEAVDFQASKGIGCIHTVSGVGFAGNLDITMGNDRTSICHSVKCNDISFLHILRCHIINIDQTAHWNCRLHTSTYYCVNMIAKHTRHRKRYTNQN